MSKFNGFTPGKPNTVAIHAQFFREVLPLIDDLAELKIILFCYWALYQKQGAYRYLRREDFIQDKELARGLAIIGSNVEALVDDALTRAVAHQVLLVVDVELDSKPERLYFVNTEKGRAAVEQLKAGTWHPGEEPPVELLPERPNIFTLYEENIGPLTPGIADRLKAAEQEYPYPWIVDAINLAIDNNVRRWTYINAILESWQQEGRADGTDEASERNRGTNGRDYTGGEYADFIES